MGCALRQSSTSHYMVSVREQICVASGSVWVFVLVFLIFWWVQSNNPTCMHPIQTPYERGIKCISLFMHELNLVFNGCSYSLILLINFQEWTIRPERVTTVLMTMVERPASSERLSPQRMMEQGIRS